MLARPAILALALGLSAYGETKIRIVGSQSISEQALLTAIGDRLAHIKARPATRSRAADAAFLVEQIVREAGFNDVTIFWKIEDPQTIRLRIDEGARDLLGSITVNDVPNEKLNETLRELFALAPKKAALGLDQFPLRDSDVPLGISRMQTQMKSIGFYDAEITVASRTPNPETGRIDFVFDVDAGKMHKIARPTIEGETVPGLRSRLDPLVGEPATTPNLNAIRARVVDAYREAGFIRATVRMSLDEGERIVTPRFTVERGQRYKLRNVDFTGLEKTNPGRIETRIKDLKGTYLDAGVAEKRIRQMIATGAFSNIRTEIQPVEGETVDVTLHITEAEARGISGTLGFDTYEGVILGGSYYDRNFLGQVRNLSAGFELTQRSLLGEVSLADPWLGGSDMAGKLRVFALSRDEEGFNNWRAGLDAFVTCPVTDHYSLEASIGWDYVDNTPDGLPPAALGNQSYQNPHLTFTQTLDYRDNPVLPTKGWHLEAPLEIGAAIGGNTTTYIKGGVGGSFYQPLGDSGLLALGARGGVLIPGGGSSNLPIDQRYFLGGPRSVRSFPERELGPWSRTGYPVGGQAYWVANIEYIHQVAGPLKAVAFFDAGGLTRDWEDLGLSDPEMAVGLGIRLDLPIGPVRFEYGHSLTQDGHDPSGAWHFAIGTAF